MLLLFFQNKQHINQILSFDFMEVVIINVFLAYPVCCLASHLCVVTLA